MVVEGDAEGLGLLHVFARRARVSELFQRVDGVRRLRDAHHELLVAREELADQRGAVLLEALGTLGEELLHRADLRVGRFFLIRGKSPGFKKEKRGKNKILLFKRNPLSPLIKTYVFFSLSLSKSAARSRGAVRGQTAVEDRFGEARVVEEEVQFEAQVLQPVA